MIEIRHKEIAIPSSSSEQLLKKKKKENGISKQTINIIRTTQRNNIDLTAIADNKANVLLSLNALIIAALIPIVMANTNRVFEGYLIIPLVVLAITSFMTIYLSAQVLKPSNFDKMHKLDIADAEVWFIK